MNSNYWGFIQKDDVKSNGWKSASVENVQFETLNHSQILDPVYLLLIIARYHSIPDFFIFRYLNDYNSLTRTLIRTISELAVVIICKILNIQVFWICHNVDKESISNYPRITKFRRWLVCKASRSIFVTNEMLTDKARDLFAKEHIEAVSFGLVKKDCIFEPEPEPELERELSLRLGKLSSEINIIITGTPVPKSKHFDYVEMLILKCRELNISVSIFIAGEFTHNERTELLLNTYSKYPEIILVNRYVNLSDEFISNNFNFYFRVYTDLSVPYTLYESCSLAIPMLTIEDCFMARLVNKEKVGFVLNKDLSNVASILTENIDVNNYSDFLDSNNWESLSRKIVASLECHE